MKKIQGILVVLSGALALYSTVSYGGPIVIKDSRISDLATTPVLGRGYSIATNTYQSICLRDVKLTEPSYDFTYSFKSIIKKESGQGEFPLDQDDTKGLTDKFIESFSKKLGGLLEVREGDQIFYEHKIFVVINLHSYYASVDESESKISESAGLLLKNNDIPGFFSSCGSYYIRSIGRTAKFVSIFTYRTREPNKDADFEKELNTQINGFGKRDDATGKLIGVGENLVKQLLDRNFAKSCSEKRLIIETAAFGLGKDEKASIISYDIETFKTAIGEAFKSMQNPRTGKVTSMELVPWVENTDFQSLIKLDEGAEIVDAQTKKPRTLLLYEKKMILNQNAEYLAEMERVSRNLVNWYYKAKSCKEHIDINWKDQGVLKEDMQKREVLNNMGGKTIPLSQLDERLSRGNFLETLFNVEKKFLYGESFDGRNAAITCMRKIMTEGIYKKSYVEIEECKDLIKPTKYVQYEFLDNYCMPVLKAK